MGRITKKGLQTAHAYWTGVAAQLEASIQREREKAGKAVAEIERLMARHRPDADYAYDRLRPGNHGDVGFICTQCRVAWPCRAFDDFGKVYTALTGFEASEYEPLVLVEKPRDGFTRHESVCTGCAPRRMCDPA